MPLTYEIWWFDPNNWYGTGTSLVEVLPHPFDPRSPGALLRFFAGQADPNDPSHFTIGYEANGRRGIIDGTVRDARPADPLHDPVDLEDRGLIGAGAS